MSTPNKINGDHLNKIMQHNRNPKFINIDDPKELEEGAAVRFKKFKKHFQRMTNKKYIFT